MVQYYYEKYTSIRNDSYSYKNVEVIPGTRLEIGNSYVTTHLNSLLSAKLGAGTVISPALGYINYSFESTTGNVTLSNPITSRPLDKEAFKYVYRDTTNSGAYGHRYFYMQVTGPGAGTYMVDMFDDWEEQNNGHFYTVTVYKLEPYVYNTTYSKGALVQPNIVAEDGIYPADGRNTSDGYWYVRVRPMTKPPGTVSPEVNPRIRPNTSQKLVYLDNGWLMAVTFNGITTTLWQSKDRGANWTQSLGLNVNEEVYDVTICAVGSYVACLIQRSGTLQYYLYDPVNNGYKVGLQTISYVWSSSSSMFYDKSANRLHVACSHKNSNSYNIQYMQSTNHGTSWQINKTLTTNSSSNDNAFYPSIVAKGDKFWIVYRAVSGNYSAISSVYSVDNATNYIHGTMVGTSTYVAQEPKLILDSSDRLHLVYTRTTAGNNTKHLATMWSNDGVSWNAQTGILLNDNNCVNGTLAYDKANGNLWLMGYIPKGTNSATEDRIYAYISKDRGLSWASGTLNTYDGQYPQLLHDPEYRLAFGSTTGTPPPYIHETLVDGVKYSGSYILNNAPTIAIISPVDKSTLYENDTINISGDAYDADKDQSVTAYYQINSDARKILATNLSQTQISLSKQFKFKAGKLFDGDTAITGNLAEGVAHTLKVWAEDSEKASSTIVERSFYVVPNRAPLLTIDEVVPSGTINTDKFKISGTASDQDANSSLKVTYRINAGNAVEIHNGAVGSWEFDVALTQLLVGENTIVVEVVDNYGAKISKTIKLRKNENNKPVLKSVARYKIDPPQGTAKGILFWIQRDEKLIVNTEISMTEQGEPEEFVALTSINTVALKQGIVEDEFYYETGEAKENIILKVQMTRPDETVNNKIHLISGVLD